MPELLYLGNDVNPSTAFHLSGSYMRDHGYGVRIIAGNGGKNPLPDRETLAAAIASSDLVIIGISTPAENAAIEIAAMKECCDQGKRMGLFSDFPGACAREHVASFRSRVSLVMTANSHDQVKAAHLYGDKILIRETGNPLWAEYFEPVDMTAARGFLHQLSDEFVMCVPGTKNPVDNITTWSASLQAAATLSMRKCVILAVHPSDKHNIGLYVDLKRFGRLLGVRTLLSVKDDEGIDPSLLPQIDLFISGDKLVPGIDLMINGMTMMIHAIARKIPFIDFRPPIAQVELLEKTGEDSSILADTGAIIGIYGESATWRRLADAVVEVQRRPNMLKAAQAVAVKPVTKNEVLERMRLAIGEVLATA